MAVRQAGPMLREGQRYGERVWRQTIQGLQTDKGVDVAVWRESGKPGVWRWPSVREGTQGRGHCRQKGPCPVGEAGFKHMGEEMEDVGI